MAVETASNARKPVRKLISVKPGLRKTIFLEVLGVQFAAKRAVRSKKGRIFNQDGYAACRSRPCRQRRLRCCTCVTTISGLLDDRSDRAQFDAGRRDQHQRYRRPHHNRSQRADLDPGQRADGQADPVLLHRGGVQFDPAGCVLRRRPARRADITDRSHQPELHGGRRVVLDPVRRPSRCRNWPPSPPPTSPISARPSCRAALTAAQVGGFTTTDFEQPDLDRSAEPERHAAEAG